jgi:hypothetical protein
MVPRRSTISCGDSEGGNIGNIKLLYITIELMREPFTRQLKALQGEKPIGQGSPHPATRGSDSQNEVIPR